MAFDWTINLGQILLILGFVGTVIVFAFRVLGNIAFLNARMLKVEEALREQVVLLIKMTEQNARIDAVERRLTDLIVNYNERLTVHNQRLALLEGDLLRPHIK